MLNTIKRCFKSYPIQTSAVMFQLGGALVIISGIIFQIPPVGSFGWIVAAAVGLVPWARFIRD